MSEIISREVKWAAWYYTGGHWQNLDSIPASGVSGS